MKERKILDRKYDDVNGTWHDVIKERANHMADYMWQANHENEMPEFAYEARLQLRDEYENKEEYEAAWKELANEAYEEFEDMVADAVLTRWLQLRESVSLQKKRNKL